MMSAHLQLHALRAPLTRTAKARYATSCTECRRRKQKCNQGRPCSNCVRRFPQPTCEYSTRAIKRPSALGSCENPHIKVALEGGVYAHLDLAEVQDAILQIEGLDFTAIAHGDHHVDLPREKPTPPGKIDSPCLSESLRAIHAVLEDASRTHSPKIVHAMVNFILRARLRATNGIMRDKLTIDGDHISRAVMQVVGPSAMIGGLDDQLRNLPMEPTRMNFELVRIHLQLLSRFKASIDGRPDPESRFMKHWIPLSLKDPLLLHIILYTAACFLNETGRVPKPLVWMYKGVVHKMLNENLRCPRRQTSDSAIMSTAQMVMDSWYWGTTEELRAHMAGLRSMVRMRGGPQALGMQGFLAKTILTHDIVISLAHDLEPDMFGHPGFTFQDHFMVPFQVSFNSPLLMDWPPFHSPASTMRIHPMSAAILDDMRSVLTVVLSLPPAPTPKELRNVQVTAEWYSERLKQMPDDVTVQDHRARDGSPCGLNSSSTELEEQDSPPDNAFSDESGSSPRSIGPPIDVMYRCIRMTAGIYYRAILSRAPTSQVTSPSEFLYIWGMIWDVTVTTWKTAVGVFLWVLVAVVPSCHHTPAARFIKTFMVTGFMMMGLENWHVAMDMAEAALRLQRWLRGSSTDKGGSLENDGFDALRGSRGRWGGEGVIGGENMIQKHGYLFRDEVPECATLRTEQEEGEDDEEEDGYD